MQIMFSPPMHTPMKNHKNLNMTYIIMFWHLEKIDRCHVFLTFIL